MNDTDDRHRPDPAFVERLDQRLAVETRRIERFGTGDPASATPRRSGSGWLRVAALILVSASLGAGGVIAAEQLQQDRRRDLHLARARVLHEMSTRRESMVADHEALVRARIRQGVTSTIEGGGAALDLAVARRQVRLRSSELDETERTGRPATDELSAPRVEGRDYVGERLAVWRESQAEIDAIRSDQLDQVRQTVRAGLASTIEATRIELELAGHEAERAALEELSAVRRRFLAGEIDARTADLLGMRADGVARRDASEAQAAVSRQHLDQVDQLFRAGRVSITEVRDAERRRLAIETELRLAEIEIEVVEQELGV